MKFTASELRAVEERLGVILPSSFRDFVTSHEPGRFITADVLHPTGWWRVQNDDAWKGPPGIVFATEVGGTYWLLLASREDARTLQPTIWTWDFHEGGTPRQIAKTVAELPAVLEAMADALLAGEPGS